MNKVKNFLKIISFNKRLGATILNFYPSIIPLYRKPSSIAVESSNYCNLKCVTCPTVQGLKRNRGNMDLDTFCRVLSQIKWPINRLNWTFAGEPLMNKEIFRMINLSSERGIKSKVDTNGMLLERYIDDILRSDLYMINIAFEVADKNENTPQFRVGYDFWKVFNSIKILCKERASLKKQFPIISLNCLIHKYNEIVADEAIELAKETGADFLVLKSININVSSRKDEIEFNSMADKWLPATDNLRRYVKKDSGKWAVKKSEQLIQCPYVFSTVILWNGDVTICCLDYDGDFVVGNINDMSLLEIWRSNRYNKVRKLAIKKFLPICKYCTPDIPIRRIYFRALNF